MDFVGLECSGRVRRPLAVERERLSTGFVFLSLAFTSDLPFADKPILTVAAASQASPIPSLSLSICDGFGIPTQLS
jgi:hypothetical protein